MARKVATLFLVFGYCSCMEMRETVERTVMVRTTGSDLQPAATGYIYKKKSDGPVSVTKMGESEVIEHFSKLYSKPKSYKESTVEKSPVYLRKDDEVKSESDSSGQHASASHDSERYTKALHPSSAHPTSRDSTSQPSATHTSKEAVKPVEEVAQEDDQIDGIANEEFDKLFENYIKQSNYGNNLADYLHGLGQYDHGIYHGYPHGDEEDYYQKRYGEKGLEGYGIHPHYDKSDDYLIGDHDRYYLYKDRNQKADFNEGDDHGRHYIHRHNDNGEDRAHEASERNGKAIGRFRDNSDGFKEDLFGAQTFKGASHAYRVRHEDHGSGAKGYDGRDAHEPGHHDGHIRHSDKLEKKSGNDHDGEQISAESKESEQPHSRNFGIKGELNTGKSFGYEIKH